jgi:predicted DNA-binding transcriptional regulator AlpA
MESGELLNEREAARRLGLSVATLRRRRLNRQPPAWVKLGSRVLYRVQDLESFIQAHLIRPLDTESENKQ